jgi:hypothetical protein
VRANRPRSSTYGSGSITNAFGSRVWVKIISTYPPWD